MNICLLFYKKRDDIFVELYSYYKFSKDTIESVISEIFDNSHWMKAKYSKVVFGKLDDVSGLKVDKLCRYQDPTPYVDFEKNKPLLPIEKYELSGRTKRFIKYILSKRLPTEDLIVDDTKTDDDLWDDDSADPLNSEKQKKYPKKLPSDEDKIKNNNEIASDPRLDSVIATIASKSILEESKANTGEIGKSENKKMGINFQLSEEQITNINLLLSINFIKENSFSISKTCIILNNPVGDAYGDLIIGRNLKYNCKVCGVNFGISRLGSCCLKELNK
jgi:hypothetical protein